MIRAEFFQSSGDLIGCSISGHAETVATGEVDLVCASVSSAVQLTANALTEICKDAILLTVEDNRIKMMKETEALSQSGRRFLEALLLHLQLLAEESPKAITIILTEV